MHVFSSMRSEDVLTSETSKLGVVSLRGFLQFAEKGTLDSQITHTGKAPDSDFEVAVMEALRKAGFECEPSGRGVAGFFIDLAVKDPGCPGRYLMGIECDGATYHSAKSARDRDRLRQEVLERLGWKISRIWSLTGSVILTRCSPRLSGNPSAPRRLEPEVTMPSYEYMEGERAFCRGRGSPRDISLYQSWDSGNSFGILPSMSSLLRYRMLMMIAVCCGQPCSRHCLSISLYHAPNLLSGYHTIYASNRCT